MSVVCWLSAEAKQADPVVTVPVNRDQTNFYLCDLRNY